MASLSDPDLSAIYGGGITGSGSTPYRSLTPGEVTLAQGIFGDKIDYSLPKIYNQTYVPWQPADMAITPNGNLYFHPDGYQADFSLASEGDKAWFIHEMTHVMQYQHGISVLGRGMLLQSAYYLTFGLYNPYKLQYDQSRAFSSYNIEQQGRIAEGIFFGIYPNTIDYGKITK